MIVEFLEGDPDRPIITGRVYNAEAMPPYGLPAEATQSGIKSDCTKGGGGFNELRFEDKKGSEEVLSPRPERHGCQNQEKRREWVGQSFHLTVNGEKREKVGQDKYVHVVGNTWTWVDSNTVEEILREYA